MTAHTHAETLAELERQEKVLIESGFAGLMRIVQTRSERFSWNQDALIVQAVNREADRLAVARELATRHVAVERPRGLICAHPTCRDRQMMCEVWPCPPHLMAYRLIWGDES